MPRARELSIAQRAFIIAKHQTGMSGRKIGEELGVSSRTVNNIIKLFGVRGSFEVAARSGRPRVTTQREDRRIVVTSRRNRRLTAPDIAAVINVRRPAPVSVTTVKRRLVESGLSGRVAAKKPLLRAQNIQKRLAWARAHVNWTAQQWKAVLWTDESKFELFGSKRRQFVRRRPGERFHPQCLTPTMKFGGGGVMVWGCFGAHKTGPLLRIEGILKKEEYLRILQTEVVPSGTALLGPGFVFQQDNDPKHTAKICREYLAREEAQGNLRVMKWPPQSPDLNPIELLWDELDRNVRKLVITSKASLWAALRSEWAKITPQTLTRLIERMPKVCRALLAAKGNHFDEKNCK